MAIQPKPFDWNDLISRVEFLGRPAYFNALDLNRQFEVFREYQKKMNDAMGYASTLDLTVSNIVYTSPDLSFNWSVKAGHVYANGVRFGLGALSGAYSYAGHAPSTVGGKTTAPSGAYVVLTAHLVKKTFQDDPVLCGLLSDEYPQRVPSADHWVYENVNLTLTNNPAQLANKICIVGSVLPFLQQDGTWGFRFFANARTPKGPHIQSSASYNEVVFASNSSLMEEVEEIKMSMASGANLAALEARLARAEADINVLRNTKEEFPLRTVLLFSGSLTEFFDSTGRGTAGKAWAGWALADGNNGTDDMRGYVPLGYDGRSYTTPRQAAAGQVNYGAVGNTGGQMSVKLEKTNLPPHTHENGTYNRVLTTGTYTGKTENMDATNPSGTEPNLMASATMSSPGMNSTPHENRQPYFVVAFVQKIQLGAGNDDGGGDGGGGDDDTTNYYQLGYDTGYGAGLVNDPMLNGCPLGVEGTKCMDYQGGYSSGYTDGQYQYNNYNRQGYNNGKAAGSANATYNEACPTGVTGEQCELYKAGYAEGYEQWNEIYQSGYTAGYFDGVNNVSTGATCPAGYTVSECSAYENAYRLGRTAGINERLGK